jgi:hypothetical protein
MCRTSEFMCIVARPPMGRLPQGHRGKRKDTVQSFICERTCPRMNKIHVQTPANSWAIAMKSVFPFASKLAAGLP